MATNNVVYIEDPNSVNINNNLINAIPQYQDMHIFAELTAKRKGRSVIVSIEGNNFTTEKTGLENTLNVNFLGINQNTDSPNFLNFTTNYYDGSTGNETQYEGFGITSIKTSLNTSFIPQVNIQFVDIRGLSFFNQKNSPYRVLFDFPPPIFNLKIKGFYGKTLNYELHLVKYTTEFKADNGNFIIDAQFVAITYAPLSDILFRYSINFPLIDAGTTLTPDPNLPPRNTNELILKSKNLYSAINNKLKTDDITKQYDSTLAKIGQNASILGILGNFKSDLGTKGTPYIFVNDVSLSENAFSANQTSTLIISNVLNYPPTEINAQSVITQLTKLSDYDSRIELLSTNTVPSKINDRLYIGFMIGVNRAPLVSNDPTEINKILKTYRALLLKRVKDAAGTIQFVDTDVSQPIVFNNNYNIKDNRSDTEVTSKYIAIDVTVFYLKLYRQQIELNKNKTELSSTINTKINSMFLSELGMRPTIYNIFKIRLNDVDTVFNKLRSTSFDAEGHHNDSANRGIIAGSQMNDSGNKPDERIYSFPLIIDKKQITGGLREERVAPTRLNQLLPTPFPESILVNKFIETFTTQRNVNALANMKSEQDADGTNKWFPISPLDSKLSSSNVSSPYAGIDTSTGGGQQSINLNPDKRITQILKIILDRFYVLTQSSLPEKFYGNSDASQAYVELYANAEATNLATSITQTNYASVVKEFMSKFANKSVDEFYTYLDTAEFIDAYSFPNDSKFVINGAYVEKTHPNYSGSMIYNADIQKQIPIDGGTKPINKFASGVKGSWFSRIFKSSLPEASYVFSNENVLYIIDDCVNDNKVVNDKVVKYNNVNLDTRYIAPTLLIGRAQGPPDKIGIQSGGYHSTKESINLLLNNGNSDISKIGGNIYSFANSLDFFNNVCDVWADQLSKNNNDDALFNDSLISGYPIDASTSKLGALLFLSNFGFTLSPFNIVPKNLNEIIFQNPAAIGVPKYLPAYIGALVDASDDFINQLKDFYLMGSGKGLDSAGLFVFADIHDVNNYLSIKDKEVFKNAYDSFFDNIYKNDVHPQLIKLYEEVKIMVTAGKTKIDSYKILLNPTSKEDKGGTFFQPVLQPLISETNILCYSQNTFKNIATPLAYVSLKTINDLAAKKTGNNENIKTINDKYFKIFFPKVVELIGAKQKETKEAEEENKKLTGDEDIINQTYYSFKNINDKWLCNPDSKSSKGYPFAKNGKNLIDLFAFVDRAMNPIGDTIINAESLIELAEDTTISIFTVLSRIISENGFVFFPIQNFMRTDDLKSWEDCFKIDPNGDIEQTPAYICMYVGGTSSYPSNINNGFKEDGIENIGTTDVSDFNTKPEMPVASDDNQVEGSGFNFYRQVRAFRVRFGEQNQSMFTDIKIDSKEFPETNESLKILSKLAGDNKLNAPIPKGQNLYNVYENRAYKATITGFGNVMIQPTQYFQLDNIPMFNGAYLILSVEHTIEPNKMMTSFSGTKILKFPVPRVLSPSAIIGYDGGDSNDTSTIGGASAGQLSGGVTAGKGTVSNANKAKYNSMYTFKIQ